ncbi:MAG: nicotinate-nucleotide adenylyltransferase [Candidatus Kentron sp. G]|nr:MAG: nicotinate-nucleotide adenylyltransferase [Candidatus Kentron sp. G]VFM96999.1 MAG: nicotinate-nucleotide adenylyltransferase [Candidatus Kentron sp. G]VFM99572.1 MAG: nicotinate-nucleotide adenylyltransferase [Candidatus Kentron sp. G]
MPDDPIGILGGTFDPVHHGHLRFALEVRERLSLSSVRLIPVRTPPHRAPPRATDEIRLRMLMAAVRDEEELVVDDRELRRSGLSYTVDTLDGLHQCFPASPLCLILGMDAFCRLTTWNRWPRILELAHIAIARRPGASLPMEGEIAHLLASRKTNDPLHLREEPAGRVIMLPVPQLDISATHLRARVVRGASIRYLVPDAVLEIITHERLYV